MSIKIMYHNNKTGFIDAALLDQMISVGKIKMFMRSKGWVMVGIDHMRSDGGCYAGPERRGMYGMRNYVPYRIFT